MGRKIIGIILTLLFLGSLSCGIIGYLNKDKKTIDTSTHPDNSTTTTENIVDYTGLEKQVNNLDSVLSNYEFIKANKESVKSSVKAVIDGGKIVVTIPKDTIEAQNDMIYEINDVPSIKAIQVQMMENFDVRVYSLTNDGILYMSMFNAEANNSSSIQTYRYNIGVIESFTSTIGSLTETKKQIYAIVKTTNNDYYTDYQYEENAPIVLTKLINEVVPSTSINQEVNSEYNQIAIDFVKNNNLLTTNNSIDVYIYKLIESGLIKATHNATDSLCISSSHNTSFGCIVKDERSLNDDYIKVTKENELYKAEYIKTE